MTAQLKKGNLSSLIHAIISQMALMWINRRADGGGRRGGP